MVKTIELNDNVESWLLKLCEEQKNTLKRNLLKYMNGCNTPTEIPCQIRCLGERIRFTNKVEEILNSHDKTLQHFREEILKLIENQVTKGVNKLSNLQHRNKRALILQTIHQRDIIDSLIQSSCANISSWLWQSQLRYYFSDDLLSSIEIGGAKFEYSFEYQGNAETLVNTELTDKSYFTLTQAMRFGFGGNPFGPAGTGKILVAISRPK